MSALSEPSMGEEYTVKVRNDLTFTIAMMHDNVFIQCKEYPDVIASAKKLSNVVNDTVINKLVNKLRRHGVDIEPIELVRAFDAQFLSRIRRGRAEGSNNAESFGEGESSNEEDKELEKLLPTPSFEDVLGTLIDETGKNALRNVWNRWRRGIANFINSDYRVVPRHPMPPKLLIETLKNRNRFIYYDLIDGEDIIVARTSDGDYVIFMLTEQSVPLNSNDEVRELIERLYEAYGCYINEDDELTCLTVSRKRIYRFDGLKSLAYVRDTKLNLEFIRADVLLREGNEKHLTSYALDSDSFTAISEWARTHGITTRPTVLSYLLKVINRMGIVTDTYAVGFMYKNGNITWSPGIVNYEPRKLKREEATKEAQKLSDVIKRIREVYENPEPPLLFIGLGIAYTFFRPYRDLLNNADTPVPILFGIHGLGKTTIAGTLIRMMGELADKVEFITEGHNIAETIPRIGGFMTSTTLPGILDDVILTDKLAEIILQIGASTSNAISIARAKTSGVGLKDKLPLQRMIFPVMNAETEREVYDQFYEVLRGSKFFKAQVEAIINRRLLLINMNDAYPREDIDLRKELQDVPLPDLLALLRYVVENNQNDLINAMRQGGYEEVKGKRLNFLWFAYLFWKYVLPKSVLVQVEFDDVAKPIRSVAEKREEERKYKFKIEIEEYKEKKKVEDREKLIIAYRRWLQSQRAVGRVFDTIADEILAWLDDPYSAGLHITRVKENEEAVKAKRELVRIICRNGDEIVDSVNEETRLTEAGCQPASWVTAELFNRLAELFDKKLLAIYVLYKAFSTNDDEGIGSPKMLMNRNPTNVTLSDGRRAYGFRFTLPELLTVLYPDLRTEFEKEEQNSGSATLTSPTGGAYKEGGAQKTSTFESSSGAESIKSQISEREEKRAQAPAPMEGGRLVKPVLQIPNPRSNSLSESSTDCEAECASKYPVMGPIAQIKYNQCIEECRQRRSMQSVTEQPRETKQNSQASETSESMKQSSTEQAGETSKQSETQQSQQVGQSQEVQNQQGQQPREEFIGRMVITPEEYEKLKRDVLGGGNESQSRGGSFDWGSIESAGDGS